MMKKCMKRQLLTTVAAVAVCVSSTQECLAQTYTGWSGSNPSTIAASSVSDTGTKTNTVFLYNVGKKLFLNRGGNWGTEAVLSEVGMEFKVVKSGNGYQLNTQMAAQNASGSGTTTAKPYLTFINNQDDSYSFYVDQTGATTYTATSATVGDKTCYQLSFTSGYTTYYLVGSYNSESTTPSSISATAVNAFSSLTDIDENSDKWIFVTVEEREKYIKDLSEKTIEQAPATFLMYDNDFARRSSDISYWKDASGSSLSNASGTSAATPPSTSNTTTYYNGSGVVDENSSKSTCGNWTANIHGASGKIYQELSDLPAAGWYEIHANVFTTTEGAAKMYAAVGSATSGPNKLETDYITKTARYLSTHPSSYVNAEAEVNSTERQSGVNIYKYQLVARVYVGDTNGTVDKLTMGVLVENGDNTTWTCIDNFQLYFMGKSGQWVVLDENQTSVSDMNNQVSSETTSTVYIHRSLTANQWNSIMLPFDMTHNDIVNAFGIGTYVCQYKGPRDAQNPTTLYFDAVPTIQKNKPYIIKPTIGEPDRGSIVAKKMKDGTETEVSGMTKFYTIHKTFCFNNEETTSFPELVSDTTTAETYGDQNSTLTFKGTYIKKAAQVPVNSYSIYGNATDNEGSAGYWTRNSKAAGSRAFRAWLELSGAPSSAKETILMSIGGIEDYSQPTAIDGINYGGNTVAKHADSRVYNICGQVVAADASKLSQLPSGLYIVSGKKIYVK